MSTECAWGGTRREIRRVLLALGAFLVGCCWFAPAQARNKDVASNAGLVVHLSADSGAKPGLGQMRLRLENKSKRAKHGVLLKIKTPANTMEILQLRSVPRALKLKWKKPRPTLRSVTIPTLRKGQKLNISMRVRLHDAQKAWVEVQIAFGRKKRRVVRAWPLLVSFAKQPKKGKKALLGLIGRPDPCSIVFAKGFGGDGSSQKLDPSCVLLSLTTRRRVGPVDKKRVQSALVARKTALKQCYLDTYSFSDYFNSIPQGGDPPKLDTTSQEGSLPKGTVRLTFWIKASGELGRIEVMKGSWRPAKLLSCLRRVSKKLRYPQARGRKPYKFVVWMRFRTRY